MPFDGLRQPLAVRLNSQTYILARPEVAQVFNRPRYHSRSRPYPTVRVKRSDVLIESENPIEGVIRWNDFSRGIASLHPGQPPGTVQDVTYANGFRVYAMPNYFLGGTTVTGDNHHHWIAACAVVYRGYLLVGLGQVVYVYEGGSTFTALNDLNADIYDLFVFNDIAYACCGASGVAAFDFDTDTDFDALDTDVKITKGAVVRDTLWIVESTASGSVKATVTPTSDPRAAAGFGSATTIGTPGFGITDLTAFGERLVVSKCEGMFIGDEGLVFPNVLPQIEHSPHPLNGRGTCVLGARILYPHSQGLLSYELGRGSEEIGIQNQLKLVAVGETGPGSEITALAVQGEYIWAATKTSGYPQAQATRVFSTANGGSSFTDNTTAATDADMATVFTIPLVGTDGGAGTEQYTYIGYTAEFFGVLLDCVQKGSDRGSNLVAAIEYWNGSAWTSTAAFEVHDGTQLPSYGSPYSWPGFPYKNTGGIFWKSLTSWAASTVNSVSLFWVRLSYTATPVFGEPPPAPVAPSVAEVRVVTSLPVGYLFRGRPRREGDSWEKSIIWEPYSRVQQYSPSWLLSVPGNVLGNPSGGLVVVGASRIDVVKFGMPDPRHGHTPSQSTSLVVVPPHDAGLPEVNKIWERMRVRPLVANTDRDLTIGYRLNPDPLTATAASWTSFTNIAAAGPTTLDFGDNVTGYNIQWRIQFNSFTALDQLYTSLLELEVYFRELVEDLRDYGFLLEISDEQSHPVFGSILPGPTQMSNLRALLGTRTTVQTLDTTLGIVAVGITVHEVSILGVYSDPKKNQESLVVWVEGSGE